MKKTICLVMAMVALSVVAQNSLSLASARAKIGQAVSDPKVMAETVGALSAADQRAFLSEVNSAIAKMPGSNEDRAAAYLNANKAAFRGAAKGNLVAMIAECFATVPLEMLPILNERFAKEVLNRDSRYSDDVFTRVSESVMRAVNKRVSSLPDAASRSTFAVMMLVRASNGSPAGLQERLVSIMPEADRTAVRENVSSSMDKSKKDAVYEKVVSGSEKSGTIPSADLTLRIAGPQTMDMVLSDAIHNVGIVEELMDNDENAFVPVAQQGNTVAIPSEPEGYPYQN